MGDAASLGTRPGCDQPGREWPTSGRATHHIPRAIGASVFLEDPISRLAPQFLAQVLADEGAQRRLVVRAQMPLAVHEEGRRARDAALIGALDVALDAQRVAPA